MPANSIRNFVFTLNNPTVSDIQGLKKFREHMVYYIIGFERGSERQTRHLQGYCELSSRLSFNTIKSYIPRAHFQSRRGTQQQAITYCKKEGWYTEYGQPRRQGQRNDIHACVEQLRSGRSVKQLIEDPTEHVTYQSFKVLKELELDYAAKRTTKPRVCWLYGASGTGKTRTAFQTLPEAFFKTDRLNWWGGYRGQKSVIIDDFRPNPNDFRRLLGLLDRYPFQVEIKGSQIPFLATDIIVTTPRSIQNTFAWNMDGKRDYSDEDIYQVERRVDLELEVNEENVDEVVRKLCEFYGQKSDAVFYDMPKPEIPQFFPDPDDDQEESCEVDYDD